MMKKSMISMIFLLVITVTFNEEIKFSKLIKNNIIEKKKLNVIVNGNNHKIILRKLGGNPKKIGR